MISRNWRAKGIAKARPFNRADEIALRNADYDISYVISAIHEKARSVVKGHQRSEYENDIRNLLQKWIAPGYEFELHVEPDACLVCWYLRKKEDSYNYQI